MQKVNPTTQDLQNQLNKLQASFDEMKFMLSSQMCQPERPKVNFGEPKREEAVKDRYPISMVDLKKMQNLLERAPLNSWQQEFFTNMVASGQATVPQLEKIQHNISQFEQDDRKNEKQIDQGAQVMGSNGQPLYRIEWLFQF